ncbi:MAG: DUF4153 domain-containing protein [Polaribacter sp.]|uniref:DUF4153 domain-containing protein n=1 Tax=Polaribacter sp. TaxID=1920175 RepID=UPI003BB1A3E1
MTKAVFYVITGITIFLYRSNLAIIANILSFFTVVGSLSNQKSSIYINWINGFYTTIVASFVLHFEKLNTETENIKKRNINYKYWFKIIGIPLVIVIVFINLYRNGNPKFDELIKNIDFRFINFQWLIFTAFGYYLFRNITNAVTVEPLTSIDLSTNNELQKENFEVDYSKKLSNELQLGVILLISLNILILVFLATDILYLSEIHQMTAPELSQQVHTGVNAIIISSIFAILIILYFFRGSINFIKENRNLKTLTFVWIFLNLIMILITAVKNVEYLISFGLTYKRIGVLFFLLLTAIGLITTFFKVTKVKNLWYLFRKNSQIAFTILIISSTINWDKLVTFYNINYAEQIDLDYLINLSYNNTFLLKDYIEKNNIKGEKAIKINSKHRDYINYLNHNSWQEMILDNLKIK